MVIFTLKSYLVIFILSNSKRKAAGEWISMSASEIVVKFFYSIICISWFCFRKCGIAQMMGWRSRCSCWLFAGGSSVREAGKSSLSDVYRTQSYRKGRVKLVPGPAKSSVFKSSLNSSKFWSRSGFLRAATPFRQWFPIISTSCHLTVWESVNCISFFWSSSHHSASHWEFEGILTDAQNNRWDHSAFAFWVAHRFTVISIIQYVFVVNALGKHYALTQWLTNSVFANNSSLIFRTAWCKFQFISPAMGFFCTITNRPVRQPASQGLKCMLIAFHFNISYLTKWIISAVGGSDGFFC